MFAAAPLVTMLLLSQTAPTEPAFSWPVNSEWRSETIPFPLEFAPDIAFHGVEELRFAPGFFDATAPNYFTYAFVWWLEGQPDLSAKALAAHLENYFFGLCNAVAKDPVLCAREKHKVVVEKSSKVDQLGHPATKHRVQIQTIDGFKAKKPLVLEAELVVWQCPTSKRAVLLAQLSPKGAKRSELEAQAKDFRCHAAH